MLNLRSLRSVSKLSPRGDSNTVRHCRLHPYKQVLYVDYANILQFFVCEESIKEIKYAKRRLFIPRPIPLSIHLDQ